MINNFGSLRLQGKSLGKLTYVNRDKVGSKSNIDVAVLNYNDSLNIVKVTPQAGFNFAKKFGTELKLINAVLTGGEARSNQRGGSRVVTRIGTLLELSENGQEDLPEVEFDAVFITGKDKTPFGRIFSADAFDRNDLVLKQITKQTLKALPLLTVIQTRQQLKIINSILFKKASQVRLILMIVLCVFW